jgi:hypothetical protein
MSKPNNANKNNYEAGRNHQGEGVLQEAEKRELADKQPSPKGGANQQAKKK